MPVYPVCVGDRLKMMIVEYGLLVAHVGARECSVMLCVLEKEGLYFDRSILFVCLLHKRWYLSVLRWMKIWHC